MGKSGIFFSAFVAKFRQKEKVLCLFLSQVNNIKIKILIKDDWGRFLNHHYVLQKRVERKLFINRKVADENAKLILMLHCRGRLWAFPKGFQVFEQAV